ncbi:hypothetical protein OK016_24085 [Vibrio chagasii]|nr:hypothetical protein [Vibrio chagasii]
MGSAGDMVSCLVCVIAFVTWSVVTKWMKSQSKGCCDSWEGEKASADSKAVS